MNEYWVELLVVIGISTAIIALCWVIKKLCRSYLARRKEKQ